MYEKVFQLTSRPFVSTPSVERFYSANAVHHALTQACSSIERASGTVLVVGPTGSGKTLFLNMIEEQFKTVYQVVNIACARLAQRSDLLQNILFELNQPYLDMSEGELRLALIDYLRPDEVCPNGILLLVDEAHLLGPALLDEVRLLTNFVRDGKPRAQLVLAGNVRLEENLMDTNLESFNQRVASRCYLSNFTQAETGAYIVAAVMKAGGTENRIFTDDSLEAVHEVSEGCPRLINQVCDHAMILAVAANSKTIDAACIHEAWADVQHMPNPYAAAAQSHSQTPSVENSIEFGSLDDPSEFACDEHLSALDELPVEESLQDSSNDMAPQVDDEGDWTQVEFGQLDEEETAQLKSLSSYDETPGDATEISYHLEQVAESDQRSEGYKSYEEEVVEEYTLAPPEPVLGPVMPLEDFDAVNRLVHDNFPNAEMDSHAVDTEDYVDVRFKDLAQFLANGGKVEPRFVEREARELEFADDDQIAIQDQAEIQDELIQSQEIAAQEAIDIVDQEDADLEKLIQINTAEDFKVIPDSRAEEFDAVEASSWQDPFSEMFEEEEVVNNPYTAFVAQQNNASLSLTRSELSILESDVLAESELNPESNVDDSEQSPTENELDEPLENAFDAGQTVDDSQLGEIDGADLLDTIHRQQAEIADQIFQLKKDLVDTGYVEVEESELAPSNYDDQRMDYSRADSDEEQSLAIETELESVNDDDRDILVITRVATETPGNTNPQTFEQETPVSTGRAIRMDYRKLFSQLRAAE